MGLHLITGYAGYEHITSNDQGAYNAATFGEGEFVLNRGNKFNATILSNNSVSIADGEAMIQGRFIKMSSGTSEEITIENGTQGMFRNDLICIRYSKDLGTNVESAELVVIKGTENASSASDPQYTTGTITDGSDAVTEFPLYRVSLNGINIASITPLFSIKTSMVEYMASYQTPIASKSQTGIVKVGSGIDVSSGTISVPTATSSSKGLVQIGSGISVSNGVISAQEYELPIATSISLGGVMIGDGIIKSDSGKINNSVRLFSISASLNSNYTVISGSSLNIGLRDFYINNSSTTVYQYLYEIFKKDSVLAIVLPSSFISGTSGKFALTTNNNHSLSQLSYSYLINLVNVSGASITLPINSAARLNILIAESYSRK